MQNGRGHNKQEFKSHLIRSNAGRRADEGAARLAWSRGYKHLKGKESVSIKMNNGGKVEMTKVFHLSDWGDSVTCRQESWTGSASF